MDFVKTPGILLCLGEILDGGQPQNDGEVLAGNMAALVAIVELFFGHRRIVKWLHRADPFHHGDFLVAVALDDDLLPQFQP